MSAPLTIAIDFDKTWTADPQAWTQFYHFMRARGHTVIIVTNRTGPSDDMKRHSLPPDIITIYCGGNFKEPMVLASGRKVDIWIDDMPGTIQNCAILADQPL